MNLRFEFSTRLRTFEHLQGLGQSFFHRYRTGDLVTRLTDDVTEKLSWYMCSGIGRVIEALAIILFCLSMMLWMNPVLTLYTAGPLPVLVGLFVFTASRLHARYEKVQDSISELNDSLESCFSGIRVVKAFAAEESQKVIVEEAIEEQRKAEIQAVRWQTIIDSLYGNIWQLAIIGVLLAGGAMAIAGEITLGEIVAFDSYVLMLVWPMFDVGQFIVRGRISRVSIERLTELEDHLPDVRFSDQNETDFENRQHQLTARHTDAEVPNDLPPPTEKCNSLSIAFEEVCFSYPDSEHHALRDISFRAEAGTLTAIVGEVGSGKSTLMMMLPRILDATSGTIFVGEQPIRDWDPVLLRQSMGYVPQEPMLLSGTIRENILFGRSWLTEDELQTALQISQIKQDLPDFPEGLDTKVGSRGVRLSGGQKQRISLARAIVDRPAILLLDDCTASLDAKTEEAVWQQLSFSIPDCTTLLITHRPATLKKAHHILVLQDRKLIEQGTFDELEHPGSLFHELYLIWSLEDQLESEPEEPS